MERQSIVTRTADKLCQRIAEFSDSKSSFNLGASLSAYTRDTAAEFLLGKVYGNLDAEDFKVGLSEIFQESGVLWRVTKHVRWVGPLVKAIPPTLLGKMGNDNIKSFFEFNNVSGFFRRSCTVQFRTRR